MDSLSPAWGELRRIAWIVIHYAPVLALALVLLAVSWFLSRWSARATSALLGKSLRNALLREVIARAAAVPVFLFGVYVVLRLSGLSRLAMTLVGGTGIAALVIGFAFRDIAENFLASILISAQHPFEAGDLVEVAGHRGYVQSVNTRSTLLMTLDGNHVQIPNATVYKAVITNFTANPNARFDFAVGIGYDDSIAKAQSVALAVLRDHPAVVEDPEPLVLVESLGPATVNLRVYFWVNIARYSQFKVRSAVIRLTKRAFLQAGISMPDEAREIVFPSGVPVRMVTEEARAPEGAGAPAHAPEDGAEAHAAEGDLATEAIDIREQSRKSRSPEPGTNLLE